MVPKFQNARQARTGRNMLKSSRPNAPSTWLIFVAVPMPTCYLSASSVLAVQISCHVTTVFVFIKPIFTIYIYGPKT